MKKVHIIFLCGLFNSVPASAELKTGIELLMSQHSLPADVITDYCGKHAPQATNQLKRGYENYIYSLEVALDNWISPEMRAELEKAMPANAPELKDYQATTQVVREQVMNSMKQYDPDRYCSSFAAKLQEATPSSILMSLYEYEKAVKERSDSKN